MHLPKGLAIPPGVPMYGEYPVPWVARWTGEKTTETFNVGYAKLGTLPFIHWGESVPVYDRWGVGWQPESTMRTGTPMYAEMNTYRQRAALRMGRCQICGQVIKERPITTWLMSEVQWQPGAPAGLTTNPPTCDRCVDFSLAVCPFMAGGHGDVPLYRLTVRQWHMWGALGTLAQPLKEAYETGESVRRNVARQNGAANPEAFFAKLALAQLTDFDAEQIK